ncbi:MAG: DUF3237 domain-containing protein [Oscillospiraceae bacterium]|nr:DUF3237 domain-containing protein [Oscillospiraceae bacterium]
MADKLVMELHIELEADKVTELTCPVGAVRMLPFVGTVQSALFTGVVAPGGMDTQVTDAAGTRNMSARYMLVGRDCSGAPCHIYVDNEGWFTNGAHPQPFVTVPTFLTDSAVLAPYLHQRRFRGEGHPGEKGPTIRFYEVGADADESGARRD